MARLTHDHSLEPQAERQDRIKDWDNHVADFADIKHGKYSEPHDDFIPPVDPLEDLCREAVHQNDFTEVRQFILNESAIDRSAVASALLGLILADSDPALASFALAIASGSAALNGLTAVDVSRRFSVSRSSVSQRVTKFARLLNVTSGHQRSEETRLKCKTAKLQQHPRFRSINS